MKQARKSKKKLQAEDKPDVSRQYREQGGPLDAVWVIVIRDKNGNDYVAAVTVPQADRVAFEQATAGLKTEVPMGIVAVPTYTAEPAMLESLEQIKDVLIEMGYNARIEKFFIMPQRDVTASSIQADIQTLWDRNRDADEPTFKLFSRALTAMREISDKQSGDRRKVKE